MGYFVSATYLLYQPHQELHNEKLQERERANQNQDPLGFSLRKISVDPTTCCVCVSVPSHHFQKSSYQEPYAYSRGPWEVQLVAQSRSEDKVVHV